MASSISRRASRTRRAPALAVAVAVVGILTVVARAGPALGEVPASNEASRTAARGRLVEGVEALRRGDPARALEKFQEAYALVPSPKIHYDFALAYLGLGRNADALSSFERFLAEALDAPVDKREKAAGQAVALRQRVGAAAVTVEGAGDGATIAVDGREVGPAPLRAPVYLDPGRHELAVRLRGGAAGPVKQVEVGAGTSIVVVLRIEVPVSTPASDGQVPPPTASVAAPASTGPAGDRARPRRIAALSVGAAGVALIGAGVVFGALAKSESDSLTRDSADGVRMPTRFDPDKEARGTRYQTLQVIGLAAGAVGVAAGIVLYVSTRGRVTVEPTGAGALAGANVDVHF